MSLSRTFFYFLKSFFEAALRFRTLLV